MQQLVAAGTQRKEIKTPSDSVWRHTDLISTSLEDTNNFYRRIFKIRFYKELDKP